MRHLRRGLRAALCHLVARAALTFKTIKQCCSLLLRCLLLSSALRRWVSLQQRAGNANPCVCPPCHRLKVRRLEDLLPAGPGPAFRSCPTCSSCRSDNSRWAQVPYGNWKVPYEGGIFSKSSIWDVPYQAFLGFPYGVPYGASPYGIQYASAVGVGFESNAVGSKPTVPDMTA